MEDIKKEYNEESGLWEVSVFTQGGWVVVAMWDELEAEDCVNDLSRWKRGE